MRYITAIALSVILIICAACGNSLSEDSPQKPKNDNGNTLAKVTVADVENKLTNLSAGLVKHYDDMEDLLYYRCHVAEEPLVFVPYVALDKNFKPTLGFHAFSVSRESLSFNKLYIRSRDNAYSFNLSPVGIEEYKGAMPPEMYMALKDGINSGYIKIRLAGRIMGERELDEEEIAEIEDVFSIFEYLSSIQIMK